MTIHRIEWIDQLKGLMLLLVIIEHIGSIPSQIAPFLYFFGGAAMPVYFALSGYLFSANKSLGVFLLSKVKTLLIPYFLISILIVFLDHNTYLPDGGAYFINEMCRILIYGISASKATPMWFVLTLFLINLSFYPIVKAKNRNWLFFCLGFVSACVAWTISQENIKLLLNFESYFAAVPFFVIGFLIREQNLVTISNNIGGGIILILLFLLSLFLYKKTEPLIVFHGIVPDLSSYVFGVVSVCMYFLLSKLLESVVNPLYVLKYISVNGMTFLGFHAFFQLSFAFICEQVGIVGMLRFVILLFIPLLFCYLICFPLNKFIPYIVGKKESKSFFYTLKNI